jgi:geranylgeranyl diphosphate synthase type II
MVGGQFIDVKELVISSEVTLRELHELKTGRLIGASVECVSMLYRDEPDATPTIPFFASSRPSSASCSRSSTTSST